MSPAHDLERLFPNLQADGYEITSQKDPAYNCIAWAAGDVTRWWEPVPSPGPGPLLGGYYWPEGLDSSYTLANYVRAFRRQGYRECDTTDLEADYEKVAIYVDSNGVPSHAARQLPDGSWTSKCGGLEDIRHMSLDGVAGDAGYGTVTSILRRRVRDGLPDPAARNVTRLA